MSDIIHLLPDSVANQIAAGEVVQRPASVVKELLENAIDAGATDITIKIVDAGRTLIQITDNGKGMSETDVRMAFERHATSKIRSAEDIFSITSMGFRGEALASIAAVAHVEVKTRRPEDDCGTRLVIKASEVESQEPVSCAVGTSFVVKNLFYNIPARRKFLKSNQTEQKMIFNEIYQVALAHCNVAFTIYTDENLFAKYPVAHLKQRIGTLFGRKLETQLLPIEGQTSIVAIHGFVGTPEMTKKYSYLQYLFVNNRFFRQKSFQAAIMRAYQNLISPKDYPPFFVFFEINPAHIDVNIHPTKTEIKFVEEYNIAQLLEASVKHTLGKNNVVPSLDFSDEVNYSDLFAITTGNNVKLPALDINPHYNPFESVRSTAPSSVAGGKPSFPMTHKQSTTNWEQLFDAAPRQAEIPVQQTFLSALNSADSAPLQESGMCMQIQKKYILTQGKTGLMLIDIKRAHSRILYEKFLAQLQSTKQLSQRTIVPIRMETSAHEMSVLQEILPQLAELGFEIEHFGNTTFIIHGMPADVDTAQAEQIIHQCIAEYEEGKSLNARERIALALAQSAALYRNPTMQNDEMQIFIAQLFQCSEHNLSADGKRAVVLLDYAELFKKFNS
ncbi:MAG: DNA mismatch repair endonuclease MutL [Bacteroidales bacterium]|jgi:DNA mismatch repair protein MutL|nr:DNA mismatch repair endonuclease MutL [Bacteroidales bacterium]